MRPELQRCIDVIVSYVPETGPEDFRTLFSTTLENALNMFWGRVSVRLRDAHGAQLHDAQPLTMEQNALVIAQVLLEQLANWHRGSELYEDLVFADGGRVNLQALSEYDAVRPWKPWHKPGKRGRQLFPAEEEGYREEFKLSELRAVLAAYVLSYLADKTTPVVHSDA